MKSHASKVILFLFAILCLACSEGENNPNTKLYQGFVRYYDTDEPISGLELKVKFYNTVPGVLDESQLITMLTTATDANGKFSFAPKLLSSTQGSYISTVEVVSEGLIQMSRKDPDCFEMKPIQSLWIFGQEGQPNFVNFYVDSAAYLKVEFNKISTTDDTVVYYGRCSGDYHSTLESPAFTVTETFPTLDAATSFERNLIYDVVGSNGVKLLSTKIMLTAGKTTELKIEY